VSPAAATPTPVFRALADPTRRALLDLLLGGDRTVAELTDRFDMTQPAISQHLKVLREAGLVEHTREGREHVYRVTPGPLEAVAAWAGKYRAFRDPSGHAWGLMSTGPKRKRT
jgi:DNA-binding transcriptional ArsR family regulator